jgi:hypothetical protein
MAGPAAVARVPRQARDADVAARLWSAAEVLTGATLPQVPGSSEAGPSGAPGSSEVPPSAGR